MLKLYATQVLCFTKNHALRSYIVLPYLRVVYTELFER